MESSKEKVSYCIGLETGRNLKGQFQELDKEKLLEGITHTLEGTAPTLEIEEIQKILTALQKQVQEQQKQFVEQISEKNKEDGIKFHQEHKAKAGVTTLPSGLQYEVIKSGTGEVTPTIHDEVTVHYQGTLLDGKVFDSTYEKDEPQKFPVNRVIPGWSEALKLMKVGDKWKIAIPAYLAYGESGYGPQIQPNATLLFEMELLKIN
ncbi:MAG: FKBP-type peptidyl-prolyl cis-trans isomerase [Simkaniaceae bacterium]|nr:FKBP-type peptidyl-prolyl cis-trans isomerase [Candidatus Sacchlamyda saccharinae]